MDGTHDFKLRQMGDAKLAAEIYLQFDLRPGPYARFGLNEEWTLKPPWLLMWGNAESYHFCIIIPWS